MSIDREQSQNAARPASGDKSTSSNPDNLMGSIEHTRLGKTLALSVLIHVLLILMFSVGNLALCVKYNTVNVNRAIEKHEAELAQRKEAEKKAAAEKRRQEIIRKAREKAKADAKQENGESQGDAERSDAPAQASGEGGKQPKILQQINETSDERPDGSGLDSIDDAFEDTQSDL